MARFSDVAEERCSLLAEYIVALGRKQGLDLAYQGRAEDHRTTGGVEHWRLRFEVAPTSLSVDEVCAALEALDDHPLMLCRTVWRHNAQGQTDPGLGLPVSFLASVSVWPSTHSALQDDWVLSNDGEVTTLPLLARDDALGDCANGDAWVRRFSGLDTEQRRRAVELFNQVRAEPK